MNDFKSIIVNFTNLFSLLPIHIYFLDKDGVYQSCNDLQALDFGLNDKDEVVGKKNVDLPILKDCPDIVATLERNNQKVMTSKKILEFEEPVPRKNKTVGVCKSYKMPVFAKDGLVVGLIGLSFDISEERENFQKLDLERKKTELALNNIMAHLPGHVYWLDKDNYFLGCNDEQAHDFGLEHSSEIVGLHVSSFQTPENAKVIMENNKRILETGCTISSEEQFVNRKGQKVSYLSKKIPLKDKSHNISGTLGISIDITERKNMEVDLKKAKERAEAGNQAKSDFISNMEHDLRTPFSGIRGIAGLLYDMEQDLEKRSLLEMMLKSCEQWENVHNRIFDALVLEQFVTLKIEPVSVSKILQELQEEMCATVYIKRLTYVTEPICAELDKIETDEPRFKLILSCLISNAIKFTQAGGITISVSSDKTTGLMIQVKDTGIGIPADQFDYIFEEFTKLSLSNKHANDFQGIGSGLFIAKKCATQLGARIEVQSQLGAGSVFTVILSV